MAKDLFKEGKVLLKDGALTMAEALAVHPNFMPKAAMRAGNATGDDAESLKAPVSERASNQQ